MRHPVFCESCCLQVTAYQLYKFDCKQILVLLGSSWDPNLNKFHTCSQRLHDRCGSCGSHDTSHAESYHLSEETRIGYSKRLALIAAAARNKALQPVLTLHPQKVLNWIFRSYTEVGTQRTMIVAVLAAYKLFLFHRCIAARLIGANAFFALKVTW